MGKFPFLCSSVVGGTVRKKKQDNSHWLQKIQIVWSQGNQVVLKDENAAYSVVVYSVR